MLLKSGPFWPGKYTHLALAKPEVVLDSFLNPCLDSTSSRNLVGIQFTSGKPEVKAFCLYSLGAHDCPPNVLSLCTGYAPVHWVPVKLLPFSPHLKTDDREFPGGLVVRIWCFHR